MREIENDVSKASNIECKELREFTCESGLETRFAS
jgi:hypothetical protein